MSPLSPMLGCLPMLLPMPVLFALYFVFQNTIEFRGVSFLWLPDISLRDPFYITPIVMGASMFLLSWIGMRGMPPNPQTKMMSYMMPVMFTVMFLNFASGLNLYYAVQNIAALPQQWILTRERAKAGIGENGGGHGRGKRIAEDVDDITRAAYSQRHVKITYIGHATLLLELGGATILTDPNFDPKLGRILPRVSAPGIALESLPALDAILLTHAHADHLSFDSLERLPRNIPLFAPPVIAKWLRRLGHAHAVDLAPGRLARSSAT